MYGTSIKSSVSKPFYTSDLWSENALLVEVLRSDGAGKVVTAIDIEKAKAVEGITCILTFDEYPKLIEEDVAIIAGRDRGSVQRAKDLIGLTYKEQTRPQGTKGQDSLYLELGSREIRFERSYSACRASNCSMETPRAYTYMDQNNRLVVMSPTERPRQVQDELCRLLELSPSKVRVLRPRMAGGYGEKAYLSAEYYTSMVTLKTGKPSRLVTSFEEVECYLAEREVVAVDIGLSLSREGLIKSTAISVRSMSSKGELEDLDSSILASVYELGDIKLLKERGIALCADEINAFLEMALGEATESLKLDSLEVRRRNLRKDSWVANRLLDWAEEYMADSQKSIPIVKDPYRSKGIGISLVNQSRGIPKSDSASLTIKFIEDGSFTLLLDANYLGFGMGSSIKKLCSDKLGLAEGSVTIIDGDTDITQFKAGKSSSNSLHAIDGALELACSEILARLRERAASYLGVSLSSLEYRSGKFSASDHELTLKTLGRHLVNSLDQIYVCSTYAGDRCENAYGLVITEVEVDRELGGVEVKRIKACYDLGIPIDYKLSKIQLEGTLFRDLEQAVYRDIEGEHHGVPLNIMDTPEMEVEFLESEGKWKEFGLSSRAVLSSIQEGIYHAIGVRIGHFPVTPELVFRERKALSNKFSSNNRGGFVKWQ